VSRRLVLQAEPGAGKTTRVPPALIDSGLLSDKTVVVLEPRRIAARLAARRVASERDSEVGDEVGYQVRFERRRSSRTRILFVTEGVLLRWLLHDAELPAIGAVVLDEFHERSLEGDLCLAFLREIQETVRPDLHIVVMSATLDIAPLQRYLDPCETLTVPGREYPVEIQYVVEPNPPPVEEMIVSGVEYLFDDGFDQSILVFVPGAAEIRRSLSALAPLARQLGLDLYPLHGELSPDEQERAIRSGSRPRVIVSTNVAEASITVGGVGAVIDSGRVRVVRFDVWNGIDRMGTERISRASATQRAGRAGRLGPGRALRLYSESEFRNSAESIDPEVSRIDLSGAALGLKAWGTRDLDSFSWLTPPPAEALERAVRLLHDLGAVDPDERITDRGRELLRYPLPVRHARVLDAARERKVFREATRWVALASERDIRRRSFGARRAPRPRPEDSDLLVAADLIDEAAAERFHTSAFDRLGLDGRAVHGVLRVQRQLLDFDRTAQSVGVAGETEASEGGPSRAVGGGTTESLRLAVLAGYPDRVVRRHGSGAATGVMVGGVGVELEKSSAVRNAELFVALDVIHMQDRDRRQVRVRRASALEESWLEELFPDAISIRDEIVFQESGMRVVARRVRRYHDLILDERETGTADPQELASVLYHAALERMDRAVERTRELDDWLLRANALRRQLPGLKIPDLERELLPQALESLCFGLRSFAELRKVPLLPALRGLLTSPQRAALERCAPARVALPSGREARVDYSGDVPVLAARVQELFSLTETPRLGDGTLPLLLHLLAPSQRPLQVTQDLAGFWERTYKEVRGELRRRYPKHSWPEDPARAKAESRPAGKKRKG